MIHGREFLLTKENPQPHKLEKGQHATYIEGFSGHEDGPGLVSYARKVIKEGGTIYHNHGSDSESRIYYQHCEKCLKSITYRLFTRKEKPRSRKNTNAHAQAIS